MAKLDTGNERDYDAEMLSVCTKYKAEIARYDKDRLYEKWHTERGDKVVERYLDERDDSRSETDVTRFNILWSNVQTLMPAAYSKMPKPEVARRYNDRDPVGRVASIILERCLEFEIEQYNDFDEGMHNAVEDRLLPGRGVTWVRYEPTFGQKPIQITEDEYGDYIDEESEMRFNYTDEEGVSYDETDIMVNKEDELYTETVDHERTCVDYVYWQDFGHTVARTWEEVECVWRWVYLDKSEFKSRFQDVASEFGYEVSDISFSEEAADPQKKYKPVNEARKANKARVCELWDKDKKRVIWLSKDVPVPLDMKDDPLQLTGFWPCPKPLYATTATKSLCPVPDYCQYQDQAKELDLLTSRINGLVEALKVVGVYDSQQEGVKKMLNHGVNNELIPVTTWHSFSEKGGIAGCVDFMPLDQVVGALNQAYRSREECKQVIYEITGISDIIRGSTMASETATAQQIKSNFANLRIRPLQNEVEIYARELLRLKAELICNIYSDETILGMALIDTLTEEDQMMVPQAMQLLRSDVLRMFRIGIETDSMIELDQITEQNQRNEFLVNAGQFIERAAQAAETWPQLGPLLGEMLMFGVRGYKVGRTIESSFEEVVENFKNQVGPVQPETEQQESGPPPEAMAAQMQAETEIKAAEAESKIASEQSQNRIKELEASIKAQREQADLGAQQTELMFKEDEAEMKREEHAVKLAKMQADIALVQAKIKEMGMVTKEDGSVSDPRDDMLEAVKETQVALAEAIERMTKAQTAPKKLIRDEAGNIIGAQVMGPTIQ